MEHSLAHVDVVVQEIEGDRGHCRLLLRHPASPSEGYSEVHAAIALFVEKVQTARA